MLVGAALLLVSGLPLLNSRANAADPAVPSWLDQNTLKPGMKGYGLTVFSGTQPERFDVEIIGVMHTFLPNQDLILIKTHHPRLDAAKVVAGMSGSPVYIDGKLIGAYAYGWQFGSEPVAGVTPISSMLHELERPIPAIYLEPLGPTNRSGAGGGRAPRTAPPGAPFAGSLLDYDLQAHAKQLMARWPTCTGGTGAALTPIATPLMVSGVQDSVMQMLRETLGPMGLEPMQGGGGAATQDPNAPTRYVDGGAVGIQLARGDVSMTGTGTVTRVSGNRLLAFGHPMMNGGVSRLPAAIAKVHWVLASEMRSFKISEPVRPLGSLINDRQAAIVVDSGVEPPMFPVHVQIDGVEGAPHPRWSIEVAHERFLAPMVMAVAIGNAVDATTREERDVTWEAQTTLSIAGHGKVTVQDFGVAIGGTPGGSEFMRSLAVRAVGALLSNPWEPTEIESVDTKLSVKFARDLLQLRGADVLDPEVDAGSKARLRIYLQPYAGPLQTRVVDVDIPRELAGQTVDIKLVAGSEEIPELPSPENVDDLIASLTRLNYPPDVLVASVSVAGQGVAFRGNVATHLPPGALDTLRAHSSTVSPEPVPSLVRTIIPLQKFVTGEDTVQVRVRDVMR